MEMNKEILETMSQMRLQRMYYAFKTSLERMHQESITLDQFVAWLVSSEWDDRQNRAVERAIKSVSFRNKVSVEAIDISLERGLDKNLILRLAELGFIVEHKDLFITGSTGTGKSYLATAVRYQTCHRRI
ncbi:hypothetical protein EZS27_035036 [termite gut metagenome]|uniref:IstB-like ATP-binding domain-containing protein n=1 Tax=termite gut metagenome TaxID=433724 RepID=A0A5J4Q172_9ZZZZ